MIKRTLEQRISRLEKLVRRNESEFIRSVNTNKPIKFNKADFENVSFIIIPAPPSVKRRFPADERSPPRKKAGLPLFRGPALSFLPSSRRGAKDALHQPRPALRMAGQQLLVL